MKRLAVTAVCLLAVACATPQPGTSRTSSTPGHGAISLSVTPNPIVAHNVSGSTYDFPFDVSVRETAGHPVTINSVSTTVYAPGGIRVGGESYDAAKIRSLGYSTSVPPGGELRYHFAPRKSVTDDRVFGSIYAEVSVEGTDETGAATSAKTTVTVAKG
jgi:hypothetical protein